MRRRKKRKIVWSRVFSLALLALTPVAVYRLCGGLGGLSRLGEGAAIVAAAINMPEGSLTLLEERFRAEIYNPEGEQATGDSEQGAPLPASPAEPSRSSESSDDEEEPGPVEELLPSRQGARIPEAYAAPIINEDFSARGNTNLLEYGAGLIRNETNREDEGVLEILKEPYSIRFEEEEGPQVLIVHTHATEAFESYDSPQYDTRNTWRSTDNRRNMAAVGSAFAQVLESHDIRVLHDTTQHDYPSYNGSYERSAETIKAYLEEYPSIKVVLDLHRDAMQREDAIVKPVAMIDGKKAAQIMIISACDDGTMGVPEWRENLRFAAAYQDVMEQYYPGLTRPIYLCYRKYNMDLTTGSLLLEFGSNANTLEEAVFSAEMAAECLASLIGDNLAIGAEQAALAEAEGMAETEAFDRETEDGTEIDETTETAMEEEPDAEMEEEQEGIE